MKIPQLVETHKHFFATYSVMALMNVLTTFEHIQKIVGIEGQLSKEDYWEHPVMLLLNNGNTLHPEKRQLVAERILRHFPFIKIMAENQREHENKKVQNPRYRRLEINAFDIFNCLDKCLRVLKKYRDHTSHLITIDNCWDDGHKFLRKYESPLSVIINKYYTVALRNLKERYNYETADLEFIQNNRYEKKYINGSKQKITNHNFFLSMQNYNGDRTMNQHLSGVGVAQLIMLFLKKKYANEFADRIGITSPCASSKECNIVKRSLTICSIQLPKDRIQSDKKAMSIALDMINELKRCPKELFDTLSAEDQDYFRTTSSDHNEVLMMRSTDRFAQLALQYIDFNNLFSTIRFHVNMGKLRYLFCPDKLCIDGQRRVRVLEQPLNAFGRLAEIEQFRRNANGNYGDTNIPIRDFENVQRDDSCPDNYPYVVDTYSHYLLANNKIEMCFTASNSVPEIYQEDGKWKVVKPMPHCRMSVYELPGMMFHMHLLGAQKTEKRIRQVFNNYTKLFTALSNGTLSAQNIDSFNIPRADIPQKVIDAINNVRTGKSHKKFVDNTLTDELSATQRLLKQFKDKRQTINSSTNKMGTRNFKSISAGKLADFLAKDIVKYQPTLNNGDSYGTDRITGMNYRVMQASIATYNSNGSDELLGKFCDMFKNARLIESDRKTHPFLQMALKQRPKNTVEFYKYYLNAKIEYLKTLQRKAENEQAVNLPFINKDKNKWALRDSEFYKMMGDIYTEDIAVELPRQMFDEDIKAVLKKMPQMSGVDFANANITYLIGEYLNRVLGDGYQDFYSWKRNYRYIDILKGQVNDRNSLCKQYTTIAQREQLWTQREASVERYSVERCKKWALDKKNCSQNMQDEFLNSLNRSIAAARNDYQKSEKQIRRFRVQDALMFLLATDTIKQNVTLQAHDFKLRNITADNDTSILSMVMPMDFTFNKNGKKYIIHSDGTKLKNYGDFFEIAHDKRFTPLMNILRTNTINKDEIVPEFDNYDINRPEVVKLILNFERLIYDTYPDIKRKAETTDHFGFKDILQILIDRGLLQKNDKETMQLIRNAFSHNSYPIHAGIVEIRTLPEIAINLVVKFGQYIKPFDA